MLDKLIKPSFYQTEEARLHSLMEVHMMVNGKMGKCMVKATLVGKMDHHIRDNIITTKNKEEELLFSQLEIDIKVIGIRVYKTEKGFYIVETTLN